MSAKSNINRQKTSAPLSPAIFAGVVLGATAIGVVATVFFFNPSTHGFYPVCLFHSLTGLNCPGCGMTRALYALLHGNFLLALKDNALFVLTLPVLAVWCARFVLRKIKKQPVTFNASPKFLWTFLVAAFVFAVLRNLPGFEWLSP
jgi:Kef-type K+ transport system membrane component KefB